MTRKIIILEGNDNSGKTTTINQIKNQFGDHLTYLRFPSDELVSSDIFSKCIYSPSIGTILTFIDALINEIKANIINADDDDNIIIDRCFLSSLVYQGLSDDIYESIKYKYTKMFQDLNISGDDVYHIILSGKLQPTDDKEEVEVKKFIDSDNKIDKRWLENIQKWHHHSEDNSYLKNIMTFKVDLNNIGAVRECIYHFIDLL